MQTGHLAGFDRKCPSEPAYGGRRKVFRCHQVAGIRSLEQGAWENAGGERGA